MERENKKTYAVLFTEEFELCLDEIIDYIDGNLSVNPFIG